MNDFFTISHDALYRLEQFYNDLNDFSVRDSVHTDMVIVETLLSSLLAKYSLGGDINA